MEEFIRRLDRNLAYIRHEIIEDEIIIYVESKRKVMICPYCKVVSEKVHSIYTRSFQDIPLIGMKTKIVLTNRKMICQNKDCSHTTFAEKFDCLPAKGKKTKRLLDLIVEVSYNVTSIKAAEILKDGIVDVGKSTVHNILKNNYAKK